MCDSDGWKTLVKHIPLLNAVQALSPGWEGSLKGESSSELLHLQLVIWWHMKGMRRTLRAAEFDARPGLISA